MGTWGYKVLENDAVLDVLYNISNKANGDRKNALYKYTENVLKTRFDSKEHEIVLGMALVDAYVNGADKRILGGHGDTFYGYKDFFNKEGDIFHKNNDLPDFTTLVDDAIFAGKYLLTIENNLGWSKPNIRKTVIEQIMLKLLMYKNDFEPNMELLAIHDVDEDGVKVKEEHKC